MVTRALAGLAVVLLATGCVSLPDDGPVTAAGTGQREVEPGPMYIDPLPPQPGDSPTQVVKGFLDAMLATPVRTDVAREFLAADARDDWDPQLETITFAEAAPPRGDADAVTVALTDAHRIDGRGAWQGTLGSASVTYALVEQDGEYRIAQAPDALVVPEQWYEQRFRQVSLSFFDPDASILVPEPVFVPAGEQLASSLVAGLLAGPPASAAGASVSFFPPGLTAGLSVPVSDQGVADIALVGADGPVTGDQAELMLAQLTTTLRQDPAVSAVRVTVDGEPLDLPGDPTVLSLDRGEGYAPYVARASSLLYGLDRGLLVAGAAADLLPVTGPFGRTAFAVRSVATDLTAGSVAAVGADGTTLLVGPVREEGQVDQVLSGATDLLPPAWDAGGRLWLVDRGPEGARVLQRRGDVARPLTVPGVTGADVRRFLVSRDGSRLVAVVRVPVGPTTTDVVVVSRVVRDERGRVLGATPAVRIDDAEGDDEPSRIRDIAWQSPTSVAVLDQLNDALARVRSVAVDGAPVGLGSLSTTIKGDVRDLVGSPVPDQPLYAAGPGLLVPLSGRGEGQLGLAAGVTSLGYPG